MKKINLMLVISAVVVVVLRLLSHELPPYHHALIDRIVMEKVDGNTNYYAYLKLNSGMPAGMALVSRGMAEQLRPNDSISFFVKRDLMGILHDSPMGGEIGVSNWGRIFDITFFMGIGLILVQVFRLTHIILIYPQQK